MRCPTTTSISGSSAKARSPKRSRSRPSATGGGFPRRGGGPACRSTSSATTRAASATGSPRSGPRRPRAARSPRTTVRPSSRSRYGRAPDSRRADAAFVLVDGRDRTLELGLRLSETRCSERVAIAVTGSTGDDAFADVTVFDPVNFGLDSDILLLDTYDQLARMIHEHYLESRLSPDGAIAPTPDPFHPGHEWTALDPFWRESNRDAARFVVPNLLQSGYDIRRRSSATAVLDALDDTAHRRHGAAGARAVVPVHDRSGVDLRAGAARLRPAHQPRARPVARSRRRRTCVQLRLGARLPAPPRPAGVSGPARRTDRARPVPESVPEPSGPHTLR